MKMIPVDCPSCQAKLQVPASAVGKNAKCSKCSKRFLIESESDPVSQSEEPERQKPVAVSKERQESVSMGSKIEDVLKRKTPPTPISGGFAAIVLFCLLVGGCYVVMSGNKDQPLHKPGSFEEYHAKEMERYHEAARRIQENPYKYGLRP